MAALAALGLKLDKVHMGKNVMVWDYDDRPVYGEVKGAATELNGRTGVIVGMEADEEGGHFVVRTAAGEFNVKPWNVKEAPLTTAPEWAYK